MSNIIKLKTGPDVPTQNDLVENEVGISTSTYRLYQGRNGSAPVQIGTEIFSGEGVPSDDIGKNGDLYIQLDSITTTSDVEQLDTTNGESISAATYENDLPQLSSANFSTNIVEKPIETCQIQLSNAGQSDSVNQQILYVNEWGASTIASVILPKNETTTLTITKNSIVVFDIDVSIDGPKDNYTSFATSYAFIIKDSVTIIFN